MPYNINKYNGNLAAVVEDGTVDNTFDIKLVGKNYAGYGEVLLSLQRKLLVKFGTIVLIKS